MRRLAQSVAVYQIIRTERAESKQLGEPLMRYSDIAREIYDSTLWAWGERGRPAALMKVEYYPQAPGGPHWLYGMVSLSPHRITAERSEGWQWTAEKAGLELQSLSDAPAPAENAAERLRQMKQLVRRFAAYQITAGSDKLRLDLRLLSQPLCRYSDPQVGLEDGAIFAFANSTNPERTGHVRECGRTPSGERRIDGSHDTGSDDPSGIAGISHLQPGDEKHTGGRCYGRSAEGSRRQDAVVSGRREGV
jgi:hypothetical protein